EDLKSANYQALHHQFLASAKAVKYIHDVDPQAKVGCMIAQSQLYPETCNPLDVQEWMIQEQMANFYADVQVRGLYPSYSKRMFKDENIKLDFEPGDEILLKEGKVDFLSFSYYMSSVVSHSKEGDETAGNMIIGKKNP